jgi:hypothetical protein
MTFDPVSQPDVSFIFSVSLIRCREYEIISHYLTPNRQLPPPAALAFQQLDEEGRIWLQECAFAASILSTRYYAKSQPIELPHRKDHIPVPFRYWLFFPAVAWAVFREEAVAGTADFTASSPNCDQRPYRLNQPEWPCSLKKSVS